MILKARIFHLVPMIALCWTLLSVIIAVASTANAKNLPVATTPRLPCLMEVDRGPCRAAKEFFFFNSTTNQCETFTYGGCEGSANRFATMEHCTSYCRNDTCSAVSCLMHCPNGFAVDSNGCQICSCLEPGRSIPAPTLPGECPLRKCPAIYCPDGYQKDSSGCHTCQCASPGLETSSPSTLKIMRLPCQLEVDRGPCKASKTRYFFNSTSDCCESFVYGGCKGSANRFSTMEHCMEYCKSDTCSAVSCLMHCPNGFAVDSNGCQICSCLEPGRSIPAPTLPGECPLRKCPAIYCPDGYQKDSSGCHTCQCASPGLNTSSSSSSSANKSSRHESSGAVSSTDGCSSSSSKTSVTCLMYCEHGFKVDAQGCQLCDCNDEPDNCRLDSEESCEMFCEHGLKKDHRGCTSCQCNEAPITYIEYLFQQPTVVSAAVISSVLGIVMFATIIVLICCRRKCLKKTVYKKSDEIDLIPSFT